MDVTEVPPSKHSCSGLTGRSEQGMVAAKQEIRYSGQQGGKVLFFQGSGWWSYPCPLPTVMQLLFLAALFLFVASKPNFLAHASNYVSYLRLICFKY